MRQEQRRFVRGPEQRRVRSAALRPGWSRPDAFESVDVLFVDEAAQMSLANVLAVSQSARNGGAD